MVAIANFKSIMHCNCAHKLNSQFLNIVANDNQLYLMGISILYQGLVTLFIPIPENTGITCFFLYHTNNGNDIFCMCNTDNVTN